MSGLGKFAAAGTVTQRFGGDFHLEPAGYLETDAHGPRRARKTAFTGGVYKAHVHTGLDTAAVLGTALYAPEKGQIKAQSVDQYGGLYVFLEIRPGTLYVARHLSKFVGTVGQWVARGAIIGRMGATGHTTGVHVHSEIRRRAPTLAVPHPDWHYWYNWLAYNPQRLQVGGDLAGAAWILPV